MNFSPRSLAAVVPLILLLLPPDSSGASGDLDTSFNPATATNGLILATAVQPDGKVIIGGSFTSYAGVARNRVARLNTDGSLDTTFNPGSGANDQVNAIALQPDGKVIIGGFFTVVSTTITRRVARLNPNGSVDTSFNPAVGFDQTNGADNTVTEIQLLPDGKVMIAGAFNVYRTVTRNRVARLLADGTLDTTFDPGAGPNETVSAMTLAGAGKVLIGGTFTTVAGPNRRGIARLNANGSLDATFNPGTGVASGGVSAIRLRADGKILAAGSFAFFNSQSARNIVRLNSDGSRDSTFGTAALPIAASVRSLVLQQSGRVVVAGEIAQSSSAPPEGLFARLNDDGSLDSSFNVGAGPDRAVQVASVMADGRIVIGGNFNTYDGIPRSRIARVFGLTPPALRNISTRSLIGTGDRVQIAGFIITGNETKRVLLRGIGPSLTALGVPAALQDPVLELYTSSGALLFSNDNWRGSQQISIAATGLQPSDDREAAMVMTLQPGSYTVVHSGKNGTTGNALIELYELTTSGAKLANISTRGFVGTGDGVMIGGFIQGGDDARVVVRALGPSLAAAGVSGALANPRVALYDGNGALVGFNINWKDGQAAEITATGLQPSNDLEAALIVTLPAGSYTAVMEGFDGGTGVGLVEIYHIN